MARLLFEGTDHIEGQGYRSSGFVTCPDLWLTNLQLEHPILTEDLEDIFGDGTELHSYMYWEQKGARCIVLSEERLFARFKSEYAVEYGLPEPIQPFTLNGQPDMIKQDHLGFYIEDFKSCKPGAFYYNLNKYRENSNLHDRYVIQLSLYALLWFAKWHTPIKRGVITFVAKGVPGQSMHRHQLSFPIRLWTPEQTQDFVLHHPVVQALSFGNTEGFQEALQTFHEKEAWMCRDCIKHDEHVNFGEETADDSPIEKAEESPVNTLSDDEFNNLEI